MPITNTTPAPLMKAAEVARLLSVTTKTLREWRAATPMRGPAWIRFGDGEKCGVRYPREAVAAWIEQRTNPTK
jgi:predicted DNA-binding transcriptional regulator AlpA